MMRTIVETVIALLIAVFPWEATFANDACSGNSTCPVGQYCALPAGICNPEDPIGICWPLPQACSAEWDPVCGCDFQTYSNACTAAIDGASVLHPGVCEPCEADPCGGGTFCSLPMGECVFGQGVCEEFPPSCSGACQPVCGCDGQTYPGECDATLAGASIDHFGPCKDYHDGLIANLIFLDSGELAWGQESGALSYNIYRKITDDLGPTDIGSCWMPGLADNIVSLAAEPASGKLWLLQVNANFSDGEGPFETSPDCNPRAAVESCF